MDKTGDTVASRFAELMGEGRGSDRPDEPICRIELIIASPVADYGMKPGEDPQKYAAEVAERMSECAAGMAHQQAVVAALVGAGWQLAAPRVSDEGDGYADFVFTLRRRYSTVEHARSDLKTLGVRGAMNADNFTGNWNLGWNEDPSADPEAADSVEYWENL